MSKKIMSLIAATVLTMSLVACSTGTPKESAIGNNQKQEESSNKTTDDSAKSNKGTVYKIDGAAIEDSGITQTIKEVSVFDNMTDAVESYGQNIAVVDDENKDKVTIVVKFEIKNNNNFMIKSYPSQATFITNTGEQVNADLWASENFDGDVYEGVTKEGHVLFNLDKTPVEELKSFKMVWNTNHDNGTTDNYEDDYHMDNKLEVMLN